MPLLFYFAIAANTVLCLIPTAAIPDVFNFWDKAQHALAFGILALIGCLAYPQQWKKIFIGLIIYGAAIEIMQAALTSTRFGDCFDWIADMIGVVIGSGCYALFIKEKLEIILDINLGQV
ncbi:MAG: VanZ family protein [Desulfamplus sp.]|nr:VanZ family protein [Desulfamplus sp.]